MRYGFLVVGLIVLVFGAYLFLGGMSLINGVNQCTSSITCSFSNGISNGGQTLQAEQQQGGVQLIAGGFIGLLGLIFVGVGFTGRSKPTALYQQPQPTNYPQQSYQQRQPVPIQNSAPMPQEAQTIYCTSCGNPCLSTMKFCKKCGASLV
ncbi:MAG TPA: hypothetical protein VFF30_08225 [Nitrososphaerales archaeon]|nr:hypothetical protein [Nitrososphaerales archaeon]